MPELNKSPLLCVYNLISLYEETGHQTAQCFLLFQTIGVPGTRVQQLLGEFLFLISASLISSTLEPLWNHGRVQGGPIRNPVGNMTDMPQEEHRTYSWFLHLGINSKAFFFHWRLAVPSSTCKETQQLPSSSPQGEAPPPVLSGLYSPLSPPFLSQQRGTGSQPLFSCW